MTTIKKILALIACLALVLSSLGLCFGSSSSDFFNSMNLSLCTISSVTDNSFVLTRTSNSTGSAYFNWVSSCSGSFTFTLSDYASFDYQIFNPGGDVTYISLPEGASLHPNGQTVVMNRNYKTGTIVYETTSVSSSNKSVSFNVSQGCPSVSFVFDDLYVDGVPIYTSVVGEVVEFTLEPGYAYIIEGDCEVSDRTYTLTGTSNLSTLSNKNGSVQWFGTVGNIRDGFSPDLNNSENLVVWSPLNSNPSGEASNYSFHATDVINVSSGAAYVITYPLYYGSKYVPTGASAVIQNSVNMSGSVYIEYTGDRPSMRRVALKSEQTYADNFISYYNTFQPSVLNEPVTYTVSDDVVTVDPSTAPSGGADAGTPSEDVDNTILGVLQRFINNISGLISSGSHAIAELVTLGSSFMMSIAAMYQWLPSGLTTLIITAFTIVLVIGVIKLLWK